MTETQYITSVGLVVRPSVRPTSQRACAFMKSYAPAISLSKHWPWDRVSSYWLGILVNISSTLLS
jgi:hypothetical protein